MRIAVVVGEEKLGLPVVSVLEEVASDEWRELREGKLEARRQKLEIGEERFHHRVNRE